MNPFAKSFRYTGNVLCALMLASALIGGPGMLPRVQAQAIKSEDATEYTIHKPTYKKGDLDRYKMSVNMLLNAGANENEIDLSFRLKQATKEAKDDGSFTLVQEFEEAKVTSQGREQDITSSLPKITMLKDKDGKFTTKVEGGSDQMGQITNMLGNLGKSQEAFYPTKPVKIGDKWKISFDGPGTEEIKSKVTGEATLVKTETIGGIKTFAIKVLSNTDVTGAESVKGTSEQVMNVDIETGKVVRLTANSSIEAQSATVKMKMEMNRLPKEDTTEKR